ncbi:MAG: alpha/beta hydrolase-fold protein [Acidobacteriota bacterium]|nr:alpha/beta hydrolase-fold protein [Acidobacteriota bacterium]
MVRPLLIAFALCACVLSISLSAQTKSRPSVSTVPGTVTITSFDKDHSVVGWLEIVPFTSKTFHNTRMLRVWLPGNYFSPHNAQRKYPVLYLQDGQNLFDTATANAAGEWHVDETLDHLVGSFKVPPMIVVGIDNAGEQRASEYLPYPDANHEKWGTPDLQKQEARGKEYARFVITEVMPFIEKHYRVVVGAANTGIGGSSYGGAVSLNAVFEYPGVFGKALIESPIVGVGEGQLLKDAQTAKALPQKMFVAIGTSENPDAAYSQQVVNDVKELEAVLRKRGMGPARLKVEVEEGAVHNEAAWTRRLPDALLFLYGR